MSEVRERAREAIDNLKGMSGSMARIDYENGKGPAKLIEDLLQALDTEREDTWRRCVGIIREFDHTSRMGGVVTAEMIIAAIERQMGGKGV